MGRYLCLDVGHMPRGEGLGDPHGRLFPWLSQGLSAWISAHDILEYMEHIPHLTQHRHASGSGTNSFRRGTRHVCRIIPSRDTLHHTGTSWESPEAFPYWSQRSSAHTSANSVSSVDETSSVSDRTNPVPSGIFTIYIYTQHPWNQEGFLVIFPSQSHNLLA